MSKPRLLTRAAAAAAVLAMGLQLAPTSAEAYPWAPPAPNYQNQQQRIRRDGPIENITQLQYGTPTATADCGPTSLVIALRRFGITPRAWQYGPAAAIRQARYDSGPGDGFVYLNAREIETILNLPDYDVTYYTRWNDLRFAKDRARRAVPDPSIVLGTNNSGGGHWMALVGFINGYYVMVDPWGGQTVYWTEQQLNWFADQRRLGPYNPQSTITLTSDPR